MRKTGGIVSYLCAARQPLSALSVRGACNLPADLNEDGARGGQRTPKTGLEGRLMSVSRSLVREVQLAGV